MNDFPKLMTAKEIAGIFRCDKSTVSRWVKDGTIPSQYIVRPSGFKQGAKILFKQELVEVLLTPAQEEQGNLKRYQKRDDSDSYQRLLSRF